jgi:hypothetical protein
VFSAEMNETLLVLAIALAEIAVFGVVAYFILPKLQTWRRL